MGVQPEQPCLEKRGEKKRKREKKARVRGADV